MKKSLFHNLLSLLIVTVISSLPIAVNAHGGGYMMHGGHGMGMHGGYGMGPHGMMGLGAIYTLDLNEEQRKKVRRIHDNLRKKHWATRGKIMDEKSRLRDLYDRDTLDAKAIGAAYDRIFALKKKMVMSAINARNSVHSVLTEEQREQLKRYRRPGMTGGMGGGMGPGRGMMRHHREMMDE